MYAKEPRNQAEGDNLGANLASVQGHGITAPSCLNSNIEYHKYPPLKEK